LKEDHTYPAINWDNIDIKRRLTWYNPLSWITEGLFSRAQLLHAQWWSMPLFPVFFIICAAFRARNKPVVFTVHNVLPHESSRLYKMFSKRLFRFGNYFIVHTEANLRQLVYHYKIPRRKVTVIPHGRLDFQIQNISDPHKIREAMGFSVDDKIILVFGAIRSYKGIDTALKAIAEVAHKMPDVRLVIAGKLWESWEPYQKLIIQLNLENKISTYLNYIPSNAVHAFFEIADLVILPYRHFDSQSGAGATAVSFRKPMIVSNVGGLPDLVKDSRCIVPADDPDELAHAIMNFFDDPELVQDCILNMDTVSEALDWSNIAMRTEAVYKKVLRINREERIASGIIKPIPIKETDVY